MGAGAGWGEAQGLSVGSRPSCGRVVGVAGSWGPHAPCGGAGPSRRRWRWQVSGSACFPALKKTPRRGGADALGTLQGVRGLCLPREVGGSLRLCPGRGGSVHFCRDGGQGPGDPAEAFPGLLRPSPPGALGCEVLRRFSPSLGKAGDWSEAGTPWPGSRLRPSAPPGGGR